MDGEVSGEHPVVQMLIRGGDPRRSAYVARGQAPAPDDYVNREPVWHLSTVLRHIGTRPGRPSKHL
ncbi:hypothetical protein [Streptomyces olivaceoviridis]|uniref:hypothetical protein n=1 Tax=Streptomyces olivaceoviridis TaxID=1921 RepID=UPI0036F76527